VTSDITSFERWLSDATRGLSAESAARVREEIQEHYDSAREAGGDSGINAIEALGNPRTANRAYRKVLLTEQEALMAPVLTQPNRSPLRSILVASALLVAFFWPQVNKHQDPGFWPLMIAIFCTLPLAWLLPKTTLERSRIYFYIHGLRSIVVVGIAWWYQGWIGALVLGVLCLMSEYFLSYRRLSIFRKLAAGQTYSLLPEEPQLTYTEALYLNTLRKEGWTAENVPVIMLFVSLAAMTVWMPATFAPMVIWTTASYLARRTLPIYTEERGRWFRLAKWSTMALAAVLPTLYGTRGAWSGSIYLAFSFLLFDVKSISLRRKLPVSEWPKRL